MTQAMAYKPMKKGKEFSKVRAKQLLVLTDGFALIQEYQDSIAATAKGSPATIERGYILCTRLDNMLAVKNRQFVTKKQQSNTVGYAFSAGAYNKGNEVYIFRNNDWEADEEHFMELHCTRLSADGSQTETTKVLKTSDDFFTNVSSIQPGTNGKLLFEVVKLVDYEDVSREVKLMEVTIR